MDVYALHDGASAAFRVVDAANEFIAETVPWSLAKDPANADRLSAVLFDVAEAVRIAAVLLLPIMPTSAAEILRRVGERTPIDRLRLDEHAKWRTEGERELTKGDALWPRSEEKKEKTLEGKPTEAPVATAPDEKISIDDFMKTELRVAKVLEAESVPKSKKLIRMQIDVGEAAPRQIVAGIAEAYQPEQLIGRTIVVVANLKPAKLMGLESNGMVLAASPDGGAPTLLAVADGIPPGTRVR
jgi:methionyl-tRNA synthetase